MSYIYTYINPVILYNNTPIDQWSYSTCVFHLVTLIANLEVRRYLDVYQDVSEKMYF